MLSRRPALRQRSGHRSVLDRAGSSNHLWCHHHNKEDIVVTNKTKTTIIGIMKGQKDSKLPTNFDRLRRKGEPVEYNNIINKQRNLFVSLPVHFGACKSLGLFRNKLASFNGHFKKTATTIRLTYKVNTAILQGSTSNDVCLKPEHKISKIY